MCIVHNIIDKNILVELEREWKRELECELECELEHELECELECELKRELERELERESERESERELELKDFGAGTEKNELELNQMELEVTGPARALYRDV